ncbi:MAG: type II secretion system protein GspF [Lysobacterales bacterium 69-70]|nr:type II secretion system F family protein [Xanthomonadaceae bacterium]ODU36408.1 MAG: type II secretion system protein GspF [Xanthomonadaceae bacterium SCN 69-320]ODV21755.1 MAG: type II secretion system protein GspF [Xanthomonadaceae bacterium SCN 69-25]OJY95955.1 MAG: type II secretion system protein GspF [Xanthomonadales bacterium 69-70]
MPLFRYKAVTPAGETLEGQMEAASADEVIAKLQDAGNIPLDARAADASEGSTLMSLLTRRSSFSAAQVVQFTQQLATMLGAGQPLDRALQIVLDLPGDEKARRMLERVRDTVRGGAPLSDALEAEHGVFSRLYVNMVRAGEAGGSLDETLRRLAEYLERTRELRGNVINAMIYPAFLVGMVFASLMILLIYVVPQFVPMFNDMGVELPLITRLVFGVGTILQSFWWLLLVVAVLGFGWLRKQYSQPETRLALDSRLLSVKVAGDVILKLETARLTRTLGTLLKNGVPLLGAMTIARNVMSNAALSEAVGAATEEVKRGNGLGYALSQSKRFPKLALQMVTVGEESGELDGMLLKTADTFDLEVKNTLDRLLAALVPVVTIAITVLVAMIMMAIILPIMDLAGSVQ